jgi:hypothetical protein
MLWFINRTLHVFGWVLVVECDDDDNISNVYPARTNVLGFEEELDAASRVRFITELTDDGSNSVFVSDVIGQDTFDCLSQYED